jgi:hypothetical protein
MSMKIQALRQPRPLPDRIYAKNEDKQFQAHADSYVQERGEARSQAMARSFARTALVSAAVTAPVLYVLGNSLGVPAEAVLAGAAMGGLAVGALLGVGFSAQAGERSDRQYDSHHARPILTVQNWDTYVDPNHNLLTLDHLRT